MRYFPEVGALMFGMSGDSKDVGEWRHGGVDGEEIIGEKRGKEEGKVLRIRLEFKSMRKRCPGEERAVVALEKVESVRSSLNFSCSTFLGNVLNWQPGKRVLRLGMISRIFTV